MNQSQFWLLVGHIWSVGAVIITGVTNTLGLVPCVMLLYCLICWWGAWQEGRKPS